MLTVRKRKVAVLGDDIFPEIFAKMVCRVEDETSYDMVIYLGVDAFKISRHRHARVVVFTEIRLRAPGSYFSMLLQLL